MAKQLIAKAWQPVYCGNNHVVALTIRDIYESEASLMRNYIAVGRGEIRPVNHTQQGCDLYCGECGWRDAMWHGDHCYMIRTDKGAKHGK